MTYLVPRRGSSSWYYREAVPSDVEAILIARNGKKPSDAVKSLRTSDKREAERRLVAVRARQHELWDEIRSSSATVPNIPSSIAMIEAVTAHVHQGFLRVQREKLRADLAVEGGDLAELSAQRRKKRAQVAFMPAPDDIREMERLAAAVSRQECWSIAPGDGVQGECWNELVSLVTKTVQLARSDLADELDGRDVDIEHAAVVERLGGKRSSSMMAPPNEDMHVEPCAVGMAELDSHPSVWSHDLHGVPVEIHVEGKVEQFHSHHNALLCSLVVLTPCTCAALDAGGFGVACLPTQPRSKVAIGREGQKSANLDDPRCRACSTQADVCDVVGPSKTAQIDKLFCYFSQLTAAVTAERVSWMTFQ